MVKDKWNENTFDKDDRTETKILELKPGRRVNGLREVISFTRVHPEAMKNENEEGQVFRFRIQVYNTPDYRKACRNVS